MCSTPDDPPQYTTPGYDPVLGAINQYMTLVSDDRTISGSRSFDSSCDASAF